MCIVPILIILLDYRVQSVIGHTKPELIRFPEDSYPARGKQLSLKCQANGVPNPDISWFKENKLVHTQRDKPGTSNLILTNGELLFLAFGPDDEGGYFCNASNIHDWTVSPTFKVKTAYFNSESAFGPSSKVVNVGNSVVLECSPPVGQPRPSVSWSHDREKIDENHEIYVLPSGDLKIERLATLYSGIYSCSAENIAGSWQSKDASLLVYRKPRFEYTLKNKSVLAGDNVEFKCLDITNPDVHVVWRRAENLPIRASFIQGTRLQFENVQLADSGKYICEIMVDDQSTEQYFHLTVIPPPSFSITPEDKHVLVGDDVYLACLLDGAPKPIIRWLHNKDILWVPVDSDLPTEIGRFRLFPNGTLLIRDISFAEGGVYECRASRSSWVKKSSAYISVEFYSQLPLIQIGPQNATLFLGQSTVLPCLATRLRYPLTHHPYIIPNVTSVPREISIVWFINGTKIFPTDDRYRISSATGSLHINSVTDSDFGIYTCEASFIDPILNNRRTTSWSSLIRIDATGTLTNDHRSGISVLPGPPSGLSVLEIGDTWIILALPDKTTSEPYTLAFRIETAILNHTSGWQISVPYTENRTIVVPNLQPLTSYHVLVRSINDAGIGMPLVLSNLISTRESIRVSIESPHVFSSLMEAVYFSSVFSRSISPSEVLVHSSLCGPDTLSSQVNRLDVFARAVSLSHCSSDSTYISDTQVPEQMSSTCTSKPTTVDHLLKNDIDDLPHCIDTNLSNLDDMDQLLPESLDRTYTHTFSPSEIQHRSTPGLVIDGLSPFICYSVVLEFTAFHNDPSHTFHKRSEESFVLTYESKPPGSPAVTNTNWLMNGTVLEIIFEPPAPWEQGGLLLGFTVRIISSIMSSRRIVRLGPTTRAYHLRNLSPWTKYDIYLAAVNCRGEGVHSFPIEVFALDPPLTTAHLAQRKIIFGNRTAALFQSPTNSMSLIPDGDDQSSNPLESVWSWTQRPWFITTTIGIFVLWFVVVLGLILLGRYRSRIQRSRSLISGDGSNKVSKNGTIMYTEVHPLVSTTNYPNDGMIQYNEKAPFVDFSGGGGGGVFPKTNGTLALSTSKPNAPNDKQVGFGPTTYNSQHPLNGTTYTPMNGRPVGISNNSMHYPLNSANFRPLPMPKHTNPGVRYDPLAIQDDDTVAAYASVPVMQQMLVHDCSHATNSSGSRGGSHSAVSVLDGSRPTYLADIIPPPPTSPPPSLPSGSPPLHVHRNASNPSTHWSYSGGSCDDSAYYANSELKPTSSQQTSRHRFMPTLPGRKWSCSVPASDESSTLLNQQDVYPDGHMILPTGNHPMNLSTVVVQNNSFSS